MSNLSASLEFRGERKITAYPYDFQNDLPALKEAFAPYWQWYRVNRKDKLPWGWIPKNLSALDRAFLSFDRSRRIDAGQKFLGHFASESRKSNWYAQKFCLMRAVLKDGIILQTSVSAAEGQPSIMNAKRTRQKNEDYRADEENQINTSVTQAEYQDVRKREREEEHAFRIQDWLVHSNDALLTRFASNQLLVDYLVNQCAFKDLPTSTHPMRATSFPFGAGTLGEGIRQGLKTKHFHMNFCVTTRSDSVEEFHAYLTGHSRNCIFHYPNRPAESPLSVRDIKDRSFSDLKFIPLIRYIATDANGGDNLILELETLSQLLYHQKAPVGSLGYRYHKAGRVFGKTNCLCTLYFVYSEKKLLQHVEAGRLKISPTKPHPRNTHNFNMNVWDASTWKPVNV
ncbi:MAG: hypothetical protein SGILL_001416 [Bacillariaceae sp.]